MGSGADRKNIFKKSPQGIHIFVVNGVAMAGKDSFVSFACERLYKKYCWDFANYSSVDRVKKAAEILGWDGIKDEKGRKFLCDLKDMSTLLYKGPMQYMKEKVEAFKSVFGGGVIFFHIREPVEIAKFKDEYPEAKTVLLKREGVLAPSNHADMNVNNFSYDIVIHNDEGLEELSSKAIQFADDIVLGRPLQNEY